MESFEIIKNLITLLFYGLQYLFGKVISNIKLQYIYEKINKMYYDKIKLLFVKIYEKIF